jgi:hypothetical protein
MSSALINRMFHVQLKADARQWIKWAEGASLHPWVIDYIIQRPDHLFSPPPKTEEPFSTPRSWHMLSDALTEYGAGEREISQETLKMLAYGCLSASHAGMFIAYTKTLRNTHLLDQIIAQEARWPDRPEDRDILYFLAQAFHAKLLKELPLSKQDISGSMLSFVYRAKGMIKELSVINFEIAQMTVASDEEHSLPDWFMMEVIRDLPKLVNKK